MATGLDSLRFIPACAGDASRLNSASFAHDGSSPRVRGTRLQSRLRSPSRSVHPRVCGERAALVPSLAASAVHPRVCGERLPRPFPSDRANGSSPRVRGTLTRAVLARTSTARFIPACAGNALALASGISARRFIPACAGNARHRCRMSIALGRFIPACAGNAAACAAARAVHPRVCGERLRGSGSSVGSSPRVRGTLAIAVVVEIACSVHPRVCGERMRLAGIDGQRPVHPRVCGERRVNVATDGPIGRSFMRCMTSAIASLHSASEKKVSPRSRPRM